MSSLLSVQRDLSPLPAAVQETVRVHANGEVSWPDSHAADAINGLAGAGSVVLGLDIRFYAADGRFYEVPWSSFEPDGGKDNASNVNDAHRAALDSFAKIDELATPDDTVERLVLITWH